MWHPILIKQSNTRANSNTNTKLWDMCAIVHRSNLTLWSWWGKELSQGGGFPYFQHQGRYNSTHSLKKSSLCRLSLTNPLSSSPFNVFTVQYAMTFWQKTPQIHKYTNTQIREYTNTQIHKYNTYILFFVYPGISTTEALKCPIWLFHYPSDHCWEKILYLISIKAGPIAQSAHMHFALISV